MRAKYIALWPVGLRVPKKPYGSSRRRAAWPWDREQDRADMANKTKKENLNLCIKSISTSLGKGSTSFSSITPGIRRRIDHIAEDA
jgi:hypothetical protein